MHESIRIPPLISGGVMLSYRCTNRCRHCLYRCSPSFPDQWMTTDTARRVFAALSEEPYLRGIHLAGGEATIKMDLLEEVIRIAAQAQVRIDYLETNASWCVEASRVRRQMERLRAAGLGALLVSVSLFHNEFVPFWKTRMCVELGREVFGPQGVLLYLPQMYSLLDSLPDDGTHRLEDVCEILGWSADDPRITSSYGVIPGGRACRDLRGCFRAAPAEAFRGQPCVDDLTGTAHFHIDPAGHLFTGLCAGIVAATINDLHPEIEPRAHPVFHLLCHEGPYGLMERAAEEHGFVARADGYVSSCDLCLDVRSRLFEAGAYRELAPAGFYERP